MPISREDSEKLADLIRKGYIARLAADAAEADLHRFLEDLQAEPEPPEPPKRGRPRKQEVGA